MDIEDLFDDDAIQGNDNTVMQEDEAFDTFAQEELAPVMQGKSLIDRIEDKMFGAFRRKKKPSKQNKQQAAAQEPIQKPGKAAKSMFSNILRKQAQEDTRQYVPKEPQPDITAEDITAIGDVVRDNDYGKYTAPTPVSSPSIKQKSTRLEKLLTTLHIGIAVVALIFGVSTIYSELPTHYMLVVGIVITCLGASAIFSWASK